jgi:hypothetical protein
LVVGFALLEDQVEENGFRKEGLGNSEYTSSSELFVGFNWGGFHGLRKEVGKLLGLLELKHTLNGVLIGTELAEVDEGLIVGIDS